MMQYYSTLCVMLFIDGWYTTQLIHWLPRHSGVRAVGVLRLVRFLCKRLHGAPVPVRLVVALRPQLGDVARAALEAQAAAITHAE